MRIAAPCIVLLLTLFSSVARGADFCVSTGSGFTDALATAAASAQDDTIRMTTGPINLSASLDVEVFGALAIWGGSPTGGSGGRMLFQLASVDRTVVNVCANAHEAR